MPVPLATLGDEENFEKVLVKVFLCLFVVNFRSQCKKESFLYPAGGLLGPRHEWEK